MSILIKGMKMPENCIRCPLQFGGWCYVAPAEIDERVAPTVDEAVEQGRPDWCPLTEQPRKLISADDVEKVLNELYIKRPLDSDRWVIAAVESGIRKLPAVDAIPTDWIDKYTYENPLTCYEGFHAYIRNMICKWRKENEQSEDKE